MGNKATKYNFSALSITVIVAEILFWIVLAALYFGLKSYVPGIRFHQPIWAWALLSLPALSALFIIGISLKNRRLRKFSDPDLLPWLIPSLSSTRAIFKFLSFRTGIAFLILGIIGPKVGSRLQEVKSTGIDLVIALDVSKSMLAEDIKPNRIERSKQAINQLIGRLTGDRISLIVFAGDAYVQLPITNDYEAAKMFLSTVDTDIVPRQGTAMGAAIELAIESLESDDSSASRAIVVITDGENHEDDAIDAAGKAASMGISVHAIGMGTKEGAPIPEYNRSGTRIGFKKDNSGNTVVSALNEAMLSDLVRAGEGIFTRASSSYVGLNELAEELGKMEKEELGTYSFADYEHRFQWFIAIGLIFLLLDTITGSAKKKWSESLSLFEA